MFLNQKTNKMIKLDKDYSIDVDGDRSFLLVKGEPKITIDKKGKKRKNIDVIGYFSNMESLINRYLEIQAKKKIEDGTVSTLKELVKEIRELKKTVIKLING